MSMRRVVIAVGILAVLLVVADRISAVLGARAVAKQVRSSLQTSTEPEVDVRGFPFLTQAIGGKYKDIRVRIDDATAGPLRAVDVDADLRGVHAPLSEVLGGKLDSVPVDDVTGTVSVTYADLARASNIPGLTITPADGGLRLAGQLGVLGQTVDAAATAKVTVSRGDLVVTASDPTVSGAVAPQAVLNALVELLSFRVSPSRLPLSLQVTGVDVQSDALAVSAQAHDVTLSRSAVGDLR
jgi:hypothetical protein